MLTRNQVRAIDARAVEQYAIPSLVLMENAGRGAAEWLIDRLRPNDRVLVLCGMGNNGGDGGVVARHLELHGFPVRVAWFGDPAHLSNDARVQFTILERADFGQHLVSDAIPGDDLSCWLNQADWVVDALLGTGLTRPVEGLLLAVIQAVNRSGKPVLALDLPSGLDADTGQPLGTAVRASATVTFVASKAGFAAAGASAWTGPVTVAHIGVPRRVLEEPATPSSGP